MWIRGLLVVLAMAVWTCVTSPAQADDAETLRETLRKTVSRLQADLATLRTSHSKTVEEYTGLQTAHADLQKRHRALAMRMAGSGPRHAPMGAKHRPKPPTRIAIDRLPDILKSLVTPNDMTLVTPNRPTQQLSVPGQLHVPSLRKLLMSESGAIADAAVHLADRLHVTDKAVRALVTARNIEAGRAQDAELKTTANDTLPLMLQRLAASSRMPPNFEANMSTVIAAADTATVQSQVAALESAGRQGFGDSRPEAVRALWARLLALAKAKK